MSGAPGKRKFTPLVPGSTRATASSSEGAAAAPSTGAPSLTAAVSSDVTLGGVQRTKFTPSIPARRAKQSDASSAAAGSGAGGRPPGSSSSSGASQFPRPLSAEAAARGRGRGRGRGARPPQMPQHGDVAFIGSRRDDDRSASYSSGGGRRGAGSGGGGGSTSDMSRRGRRDVKSESGAMDMGGSSDDEDLIDEKDVDAFADADERPTVVPYPPSVLAPRVPLKQISRPAADLFDEQQGELSLLEDTPFFFQLPTSIPGVEPPAAAPTAAAVGDTPAADGVDAMETDQPARPAGPPPPPTAPAVGEIPFESTLPLVREGPIGRLLVHRSGRLRLVIGDVEFNVGTGTECSFAQQLVAIDAQHAHAYVLGEIGARFVCQPAIPPHLPGC